MNLQELALRPTITVAELADVLQVGRNQAYAAVHEGLVPSIKVGCTIRIPTPALLRVLGHTPTHSESAAATAAPLATTEPVEGAQIHSVTSPHLRTVS